MDEEVTGMKAATTPLPSDTPVPPLQPPTTPDGRGIVELAVGFGIALVGLVAFALVAGNLHDQEAMALDVVANPFLHAISSPGLDTVMTGVSNLGSGPALAVLSATAIAILLSRGLRARALFLATAIGGSVALNGMLKVTVQRPRPALPWAHVLPDYSFPSGHTMNSIVFYMAVALIVWVTFGRRTGSIAVLLALAIALAVGFSRIYLGYHYLSDVVGGLTAGLAWLFVVALAFETIPRTWARRHGSTRDRPSTA